MIAFGPALDVANAVLYEGYMLYPYTASARKNRIRWQFGVVVPERYAHEGTGEHAEQQTEILVDCDKPGARVDVLLRFLHVKARRVEATRGAGFEAVDSLEHKGEMYLTFDEGVEREVLVDVPLAAGTRLEVPVEFAANGQNELLRDRDGVVFGRIVRECWALRGTLTIEVEAVAEDTRYVKLRALVRNFSDVVEGARSEALRTSFVSTHLVLAAGGARFVSVLDAPDEVAAAAAGLQNRNVFPVLIGDQQADVQRAQLALASPIILYDFPAVAPQTETDAFDSTEIDELLTLSVLSLSDAERAEARATDPRTRALIERAERFGIDDVKRLHDGALQRRTPIVPDDPFAAVDVPSIDCVFIDNVKIAQGSAVRLRPKRRADAWDMFLEGKVATVRAIHQDLEDIAYVAVTVDDDPASDLHEWYGRSFFFYPDEVEPILASAGGGS
ncbi:MAG: hypothetical protein NVSMB5_13850 [Candidatus Velthaea sp.]